MRSNIVVPTLAALVVLGANLASASIPARPAPESENAGKSTGQMDIRTYDRQAYQHSSDMHYLPQRIIMAKDENK